ncbi:hypothetical protein KGM_200045 [Danaus plexippus plexippus]|uniref:Uncharacterized protein n=1 Tax=Danaus plexippus plexippus TaxID=278856 RepID=A0A212FPJ9_DANPL|nr:hypothetical protein KGM_200045 [Danaus plexippus plexippus]
MRLGRCVAFLAAAAFLLPFTILLMVADQQYNLSYNYKRVFYQEVRYIIISYIYYKLCYTFNMIIFVCIQTTIIYIFFWYIICYFYRDHFVNYYKNFPFQYNFCSCI